MAIWCDYRLLPQGLGHVCELHCHAHYEITLLLSGRVELFNGAYQSAQEGPCLLIEKPFSIHNLAVVPGADYERYNLYFSAGLLGSLYGALGDPCGFFTSDLTILPLDQKRCGILAFYMRRMLELEESQALCTTLLTALFGEISVYARERRPIQYSTGNRMMAQVLQYIDAHLEEELCLAALAEVFHMGVTKLCADFKEYTLCSVAQYIRLARVERAKQYLQKGTAVLETAMRCGFSNECHFITVFRRAVHCTPGQYARRYRERQGLSQ